jgi:signal transduction histidine kinase
MPSIDIAQQLTDVRAAASQLVAQLGADATSAAPFLHTVAALEQRLRLDTATDTRALAAPELRAKAQNALLQQVLTYDPTGIASLSGQDLCYTFTNPIYQQIAGRTDMVGKTLREVFPELEGQGIYEILQRVYNTGVPFITPEIMIQLDRDGDGIPEDIYFDLSYRPLRDDLGTITGVLVYALDIGDRRALEHERDQVLALTQASQYTAEAERYRLLTVLHQAPAAMCTLEGPEHVFTFTNAAYNRLTGRSDMLGKPVRLAMPDIENQGFFELLDAVYTTGVPFIGNEVPIILDKHGTGAVEHAFLNFIYAPLLDPNDRITGVFVQAVEVTELVAARQDAEAAVIVRDQFLSIAAHELKTPLTTVLGCIEVLQRRMRRAGAVDERTDRTLSMIGQQGQRLNRLIDILMDVARINQGQLTLERAPLDLAALAARMVAELQVTIDDWAIQIVMPAEPCMVWGDGLRLEQVLVNLVQNAVKYSRAGSTVAITVGDTGTQVWFRIRDQGMGIPAEAVAHVFERFYRVLEGTTQLIPGMGIGLSVVKDIVTLHGGSIDVESIEGVGSTFTLWLPQLEADLSVRSV